jgi:hypothetical protein
MPEIIFLSKLEIMFFLVSYNRLITLIEKLINRFEQGVDLGRQGWSVLPKNGQGRQK